jgi:hypothetical protein
MRRYSFSLPRRNAANLLRSLASRGECFPNATGRTGLRIRERLRSTGHHQSSVYTELGSLPTEWIQYIGSVGLCRPERLRYTVHHRSSVQIPGWEGCSVGQILVVLASVYEIEYGLLAITGHLYNDRDRASPNTSRFCFRIRDRLQWTGHQRSSVQNNVRPCWIS